MMKGVALCALVLLTVHSAHALAGLRTVRRVPAVVEAVAPVAPAASEGVEMVMAEIRSEADSIIEDGSNDASAAQDAGADSEAESVHDHFRQFTSPMSFLPNDHTTLVEVESAAAAAAGGDDEGGADKGSNPTYILPVDPFNYFPFFNGFSNVNPFSQFYPPAPYLYPQHTNYMHQYANHGAGHPPGYPYPGSYGGVGAAGMPGMYGGAAHAGFPNNYPGPSPHMHYPFGAYKMDVSGPDVRTGSNNPPPFPQFSEVSSSVKLIRPEIIPKAEIDASADESDVEEDGDSIIASFIQVSDDSEDESESEEESEGEDSTEVEFESDSEGESAEAEDVEILDESADEEMSSDAIEFESEEGSDESEELEYTN